MNACADCGRLMRPRNTTAAQYPGTVSYNGVRCTSCTGRIHDHRSVREARSVTCARCGIVEQTTNMQRKYELCSDCRSVLTRQERSLWAA